MSAKIAIIGRGLAGAILSLELQSRGVSHHIYDEPGMSRSSNIAAGVVNPLVLKRLKVVDNASSFLAHSYPFFEQWQKRWQAEFFFPIPIWHILHTTGELNQWSELSMAPSHQPFLGAIHRADLPGLKAPAGYGVVNQTAWLDTEGFLKLQARNLPADCELKEIKVDAAVLAKLRGQYEQVIVANGHLARQLIPQTAALFSPTRGELLIIKSDALPHDRIIHGPVFILPIGKGLFKVGATYHWDQLTDAATAQGRQQLEEKLAKIFSGSYSVVNHLAGVRPNVKDRKPLLGQLEDRLYLFNGMGSRGVLMAPLLAKQFADHLLEDASIEERYDVNRFQ